MSEPHYEVNNQMETACPFPSRNHSLFSNFSEIFCLLFYWAGLVAIEPFTEASFLGHPTGSPRLAQVGVRGWETHCTASQLSQQHSEPLAMVTPSWKDRSGFLRLSLFHAVTSSNFHGFKWQNSTRAVRTPARPCYTHLVLLSSSFQFPKLFSLIL